MKTYRTPRPAFTLTELLVTMLISLTIMAIALPLVKFNLDESRVREASRQLNAMFAKAKAQAALLGRPVGIVFERDSATNSRCTQLHLAEIPLPFAGAVLNSRCRFTGTGPYTVEFVSGSTGTTADTTSTAMLSTLITNGAKCAIRFDFKGPLYQGTANVSGTNVTVVLNSTTPLPPINATQNLSYQLYREPQRINNQELELSRGTYIALDQSGFGGNGTQFTPLNAMDTTGVAVMFSPAGHVSSAYASGLASSPHAPDSTVHFLVVRERNAATSTNPMTDLNKPINDPTNLWVSVGHLSGAVTTSDNQPGASPRYYAQRHDVRGGR